ncbi:uncharacterized protein SPPG_05109 [Spizellomyces punctatus DAOM BR117]|uniref:CHCH domain-containing protein n=1 Tax=Spizellomyces punctatus (strain DAOM BR117) TaxID=645134 RepID=A0A0L0HG10_SPIPD|nr:uncharacterized protein SPPG_05109 [Spizellomyces punctatus DAOM BR117]KNC99728.1 hypothetical protein SPPG_05109 [Spizellomyces punctatus DAOM BR117]|eukprot:XP_016607768.1 hypothetical protein SPPG_05109 [Spizellomyces punctatus DAOM BR117]
MARQRRSAAPSRPSAQHTQTRPATTAAHAPAAHPPAPAAPAPPAHVPSAAPQQPGIFAQMASTAAGVAVGSAVGHTIGAGLTGMFGGGSSAPAPAEQAPPQQHVQSQHFAQNQTAFAACEPDQKAFLRCLDQNSNDINACQFYLDMLKQCQAASRQTLA